MKHINPAIVLAQFFHNTYEQLAPCSGYETRADTKLFDPASTNGRLMTAVCGRVMMLFAGVLIIAVAVSGLTGYVAGTGRALHEAQSIATLQAENQSLHSLLNQSESKRAELLSLVDWVDESGWRSGYRDACIQVALMPANDCWSLASAVVRSQ